MFLRCPLSVSRSLELIEMVLKVLDQFLFPTGIPRFRGVGATSVAPNREAKASPTHGERP
jgi:hypothetical protein